MPDHTKIDTYILDPRSDAERIKDLCAERDLTILQLTRMAGLSSIALRSVISGRSRLSLDAARAISVALGVPLEAVTGRTIAG